MVFAIAGIIIVCAIIVLIEFPTLKKAKSLKETIIFAVFLLIGGTLAVLQSQQIAIPNPAKPLSFFFNPITTIVNNFL